MHLAVEPKIAIARILADLNLAVWYGIPICIYASRKFWQIFNLAVVIKTTKPPNLIPCQIFRLYGNMMPLHAVTSVKWLSYIHVGAQRCYKLHACDYTQLTPLSLELQRIILFTIHMMLCDVTTSKLVPSPLLVFLHLPLLLLQ